jgi:predicted TPR repeat methyltransferase
MNHYATTIQTYNAVVLNYEAKFMQMDLYNDTYDAFCAKLKIQARVLDIGCGPGNITQYFLRTRPDLAITGIDLAPNMIERATVNCPGANFIVKDALKIDELTDTYDGIVIGFCMPYLSKDDCTKLIQLCSKKLTAQGLIYISSMEDDYSKSGFETTSFSDEKQVYVYYHQAQYIQTALTNNGFDVLQIERKAYPEADGTFLTDMIFIAQKK